MAPFPSIHLSATEGTIHPDGEDAPIWISIDWECVAADFAEEVLITIASQEGEFEQVHLSIRGDRVSESFRGFVEAKGCMSIAALGLGVRTPYQHHSELGRSTEGAVTIESSTWTGGDVPFLEYLFSDAVAPTATDVLLRHAVRDRP